MSAPKFLATGRCLPAKVVTNDDLSRTVDTNDEWVFSRTGIHARHFCQEESGMDLAEGAARQALARSGLKPEDIGVCLVATFTPDFASPSMACMLQQRLGLKEDTICFDLNAACTGFLFALHTAECLLNASPRKFGLVIGAEALSRVLNWEDRSTCILFGDGAGAAVVECRAGWPSIGAVTGCRGDDTLLHVAGPGSGQKILVSMDGSKVFRFAVETVPKCMDQVLKNHELTAGELDFFVFHQANERIIDLVVRKYGIPAEKYYKNLAEYGNTSAASIPIVLSELQEQGKVRSGSRVLLAGFGGGLTWGGALVEFA